MLKLLYESPIATLNPIGTTKASWIADADAMLLFSPSGFNTQVFRIYRDGTSISLGVLGFNPDFTDAIPTEGAFIIKSVGVSYELHPITWVLNKQKVFSTSIATPQNGLYLRNRAGVMKFYEGFGRNYRRFDVATDVEEVTVEVFPSGAGIFKPLRWAYDQVIGFFRDDGSLRLWDVDSNTLVLDSFIEVSDIITIDTKYQNIMSITTSGSILQTYALEVEPAQFSNFTATPGNFDRYHTEQLEITVLGADGEVAAGVQVEWRVEILGSESGAVNAEEVNAEAINAGASVSAARGKITPNVSTTDSAGIARATYCPPGVDWVSGADETITITVKT